MATLMKWHDKHGDWLYDANTPEEHDIAALKIVKERLVQGYLFWPDDAEDIAKDILEREDGKAAWDFLEGRQDHEYERVSVVTSR